MSYEKDKLDSYVTSASLSTALAPYITSNSVSAAIAGINLGPYMTSNSISAAVTTDTLTVRGTASVSATLSAAAVTVAGLPVSQVLIGYKTFSGVGPVSFSGSWSDFFMLELRVLVNYQLTATGSVAIFTDGGTTPIMAFRPTNPIPPNNISISKLEVTGGNGRPGKYFELENRYAGGLFGGEVTATANSGFVNCVKFGSSARTASYGAAMLIGHRTS